MKTKKWPSKMLSEHARMFIRHVRVQIESHPNSCQYPLINYFGIEDDLKSTSSEQNNKRLAFVHYVYPRTSQKSHFKQFEEN